MGEDIAPGMWKISGKGDHGTVANPCKWSLWSGDSQITSSAEMAWGDWHDLNAGLELITHRGAVRRALLPLEFERGPFD